MSRELDDLEREFADLEQETGPDHGPESRLSRSDGGGLRTLPIAVAVIALVAFGAIVWYAYSQGVRSGSEEAAPLLAPEGAAKVQPDDPGGMEIPHTDKQVFNRISGDEEAADRVERILPPPEDPMQPPAPQPEAQAAAQAPAPAAQDPVPPSITESPAEDAPADPPLPDEKLAAPAEEPPTAAPAPAAAPAEEQTAAAPQPAPAAEPAPAPEPEPAVEPEPAPEPAPAAADPTSGWQVQIAALRSEAGARTAWDRAQEAHGALLGDLSLAVQRAVVNGVTYFRVRGGPLPSREAATDLCNALKAEDQPCLVAPPGG
ncbi:MAG: SPOR domain-containing protein [Alphaproteobacteria bacterium]|nr:SPOR domain-containing protein [Alphaproteobacteria bacterium]